VEPPPPEPPKVVAKPAPRKKPWYKDWLAPTLLAVGGVVMIACGADFKAKQDVISHAGDSYDAHEQALSAPTLMTVDAALMGAGAALVAGGAIRWVVVAF
jgi:hypothetical protein